ncbi:MAG: hypothetical protein NTW96_10905 [Planctomycetia bacterium]|nr:hypothetical protein [Planctomycetia bacterium]
MINAENGELRAVAWKEICPWLILYRTFRLAIGFRMLVLSAAAILLTLVGWAAIGYVFSGTDDKQLARQIDETASPEVCPWRTLASMVPDQPGWPERPTIDPIRRVGVELSAPFRGMFGSGVTVTAAVYWLLCGLWALAVWTFAAGGITRTVAVRLARDERIGWGQMLSHMMAKWKSYFAAPLFPLLGVLLATVPMLCIGVLLRTSVSLWIAALVWPVLLLGGLMMAILLLGLLFGWPLMWATISSEGTDSFDALSRAYAYVFQRPLHYLFYIFVAAGFGVLGWLLVSNFAAGVIHLTYWAASWGSGQPRIEEIMASGDEALGGFGGAGAAVIRFWADCVKLLAVGYLYSYFWTASTAVYFLLRRDVDATEMDEVWMPDQGEGTYDLPPIGTDERGAPVAEDDAD